LYVAQMQLAQVAWREGKRARLRELLDFQVPAAGQEDLRGYEWYFLRRSPHGQTPRLLYSGEQARHGGGTGVVAKTMTLALTEDGGQVFVAAFQATRGDSSVTAFDAATGRAIGGFPALGIGVDDLRTSPDGKYLAAATEYGLRIWDIATRRTIR